MLLSFPSLPHPCPLIPQAAQQTEVYWMALARDIPFSEYATNDIIRLAAGIYVATRVLFV